MNKPTVAEPVAAMVRTATGSLIFVQFFAEGPEFFVSLPTFTGGEYFAFERASVLEFAELLLQTVAGENKKA